MSLPHMYLEIDLFSYPETLGDVKRTLQVLRNQIKILEAFEHAKDRLNKVQVLESNTLSKCKVFISYVNHADPQSNFFSEVSHLKLNELAFASICFEDRRLKTLLDSFKASYIQKYVGKESIACLNRSEIFTRINNVLVDCKDSQFDHMYSALVPQNPRTAEPDVQVTESWSNRDTNNDANHAPIHLAGTSVTVPDPQPQTAAERPDAYELLGALWENVQIMFGGEIANALRDLGQQSSLGMTHSVRSRYPQLRSGGDALVCFDIGAYADWVCRLFRTDKKDPGGACVAAVTEVFGNRIANAIEESDLRKWERRNGQVERTNCVKMMYQVQLRICYDTGIANALYSHEQILPHVYDIRNLRGVESMIE